MDRPDLSSIRSQLEQDLTALGEIASRVEQSRSYLMGHVEALLELVRKLEGTPRNVVKHSPTFDGWFLDEQPLFRGPERTNGADTNSDRQIRSPKVAAVVEIVRTAPEPISPKEVRDALIRMNLRTSLANVSQILKRMPNIERIGRGRYSFVE